MLPTSIVFSILYNIPKFFELIPCFDGGKQGSQNKTYGSIYSRGNSSLMVSSMMEGINNESQLCDPNGIQATPLRRNFWYIIFYTVISKLLLVEIIPWVIVIGLNYCTWKRVKEFNTVRERTLGCNNARGKLLIKYLKDPTQQA